jgi:probable HAF family extracellular repeat protein
MSQRFGSSAALILVAFCTGVSLPVSALALSYTITDLGTLPGGGWSTGYGLNQAGVVVGGASAPSGYHGFSWKTGHMKDLGTWNGQALSTATSINTLNKIVGSSFDATFGTQHAVKWSGRTVQNLGSLPGASMSEAEDINDAGQIVGSAIFSYTQTKAFLWQNGTMTGLGTLGGSNSAAYCINASGQIVGSAYTTAGTDHAFRWQNGTMTDLGTPAGWQSSLAIAISDNGQIVGFGADASGAFRGFSYVSGVWTVIGPIGTDTTSEATDVNSAGYVVGFSTSGYRPVPGGNGQVGRAALSHSGESATTSSSDHAWVYVGGTQYDLNTLIPAGSGWRLIRADAINENGQITGTGWSPSGAQHGYLLTPAP